MTKATATGGLSEALQRKVGKKIYGQLETYAIVAAAFQVGKKWYDRIRAELTYTVSVFGDDDIYMDLHRWVLDRLPESKRKAVVAVTSRSSGSSANVAVGAVAAVGEDRENPQAVVDYLYDGSREQVVFISGHRIKVRVAKPEGEKKRGNDRVSKEDDPVFMRRWEKIVFTAANEAGRQAVLNFIAEVAQSRLDKKTTPELNMLQRWGGWEKRFDLPARPLDTVILPEGQLESLVADVEQFKREEVDYIRLGMPYHRGYLLHGPPGTGKSSIPRAIASHFRMDLSYIPLSDVKRDTDLLNAVANVPPGSIVLLEDIDVLSATRDRDDDKDDIPFGISLSGFLNVLDGVATPHGLIAMMTTNHIERLDPAIRRTGRADVVEEIGYVVDEQLERMFQMFYGREMTGLPTVEGKKIAAVDVVESFKKNRSDPEAAVRRLEDRMMNPEKYLVGATA